MEQYLVTGMSCAACQARVEKAVSAVPGVTSCAVSLLTNSMGVEGSAEPDAIIRAVENAGYGAQLKMPAASGLAKAGGAQNASRADAGPSKDYAARLAAEEEALADHETPALKRRLILSIGFLALLMYISMGHGMFGWPLPAFFEGNHVAMGLAELLLAAIVMLINRKFFVSGFTSLWHRAPNMDSLIALGSAAGFVYSTVILFLMSRAVLDGDAEAVHRYMMEFYFESSAMILTLITVGKMLEARSKGKTTDALKSLMKLAPKTVTLLVSDEDAAPADRCGTECGTCETMLPAKRHEETVPVDMAQVGDLFAVRPGENIPLDGVVVEGTSAVNEAALTGESLPVDKEPGSTVSSATLNQSGYLVCRATRVGEDTTLAQIIQMVSDAAATKAPVARLADRISGVFVPAVIGVALVTFAVWMLLGQTVGYSLARAITVLVVSCPCALGLATPVSIMVGSGVGARNGILFKTAAALQETGNVQIVALDKTGTITRGEPELTDIVCADGVSEAALLRAAYALEVKSEHPLARAVVKYAEEKGGSGKDAAEANDRNRTDAVEESGTARENVDISAITDFAALSGSGLKGREASGSWLYGGNEALAAEHAELPEGVRRRAAELAEEGKTPLFFVRDNTFLGILAVADTIKDDSAVAILRLQNMGIHVVMLTGDNERTAQAIGRKAGVDEVVAGVKPDGKEEVIRRLQAFGKVAMVGDGINDAPALTRADVGIAIGAGTDVAIDAADVVLMKSSLADAAAAIALSRAAYRNILQNLFWALIYNTLLIPAAAGLYAGLGLTMNPMLGAAAMSLSSFCVVTNALRLNFTKLYDAAKDKKSRRSLPNPRAKLLEAERPEAEPLKTELREAELPGAEPVAAAASLRNEETMTKENIQIMKKTMTIEGMMCMHCEATVKKALEALDGVAEAQVSHESGSAIVTLTADVPNDTLKNAVEAKDYKVISVE